MKNRDKDIKNSPLGPLFGCVAVSSVACGAAALHLGHDRGAYYETGPARGIALLSDYLKKKVKQGILAIDDCEVVAAQLIEALLAPLFKPVLFNFGKPPTQERIRYVVGIAVRAFLAAYRTPRALG
jgi:AefR-like transcriptional repressor, C-terminal domain